MAGVCTGNGPCDVHPTGHGGDNFVTRGGGFDPYLRAIINALKRKGHSESEAVQLAIGTVQRWARGEGNVTAATRARAAKSLAHWEALRAKAHANLTAAPANVIDLASLSTAARMTAAKRGAALPGGRFPIRNTIELRKAVRAVGRAKGDHATVRRYIRRRAKALNAEHLLPATWNTDGTVDLATPVADTNDGPSLTMPAGPHRYRHGWVRIDAALPSAVERATRAVTTDGHALLHGKGMVATAQQVSERVRSAGHGVHVQRVHVAGKQHLHIRRTTR